MNRLNYCELFNKIGQFLCFCAITPHYNPSITSICGQFVPLHYMTQANGVNIARYMLLFNYAVRNGKRAKRGTRMTQVPIIAAVGYNEGLRVVDLMRILDMKTHNSLLKRLNILISVGYVTKDDDKRYWLTAVGWSVFNALNEQWQQSMRGLIDEVKAAALRELRAEGKIG